MGLFIFFLVMVIVLALAFTGIVALWVYKDAKARGERGWLWVCIVLLSSPLLGGLLYLLWGNKRPALPLLRVDGGQGRTLLLPLRQGIPGLRPGQRLSGGSAGD